MTTVSTNNYKRLAMNLNMYFEYTTRKRFEDVWRALEDVLEELDIPKLAWADGHRMRLDHAKEADAVWGTNQYEKLINEPD